MVQHPGPCFAVVYDYVDEDELAVVAMGKVDELAERARDGHLGTVLRDETLVFGLLKLPLMVKP